MRFTDTHSHIYDEAFDGEQDLIIARAMESGTDRMIIPDIDSHTREQMFALTDRYPGTLFPTLGIHPTSVNENWRKEVEEMERHADRKIWAIGECGMDCYWSTEHLHEQKEVFRIMLRMAHDRCLPVIIHTRESTGIILDLLKENRHLDLRGVFHAFSGSIETFREIQKSGDWHVGIGGVLTFKNASIAETVRSIPLDRILLETDSPYLTPVPHRGKRNESSYIPLIAGKLASIKETDIEEVAAQTTSNAEKLFGI